MSKSIEEVAAVIEKKIMMTILNELPSPSCPLKKQQNDWKINEVKKIIAARLSFQSIQKKVEK